MVSKIAVTFQQPQLTRTGATPGWMRRGERRITGWTWKPVPELACPGYLCRPSCSRNARTCRRPSGPPACARVARSAS